MERKLYLELNNSIAALLLLVSLGSCKTSSTQQEMIYRVENPNLDPLTPEQVIEYIVTRNRVCGHIEHQV